MMAKDETKINQTTVHERLYSECRKLLKAKSIPQQDPIMKVIEYFFSHDDHVSQEDIEHHFKKMDQGLASTEIKKALDLLEEYGFAEKKIFEPDQVLYEHLHLNEHHDHMYCLKCGKIIEFHSPEIEELQIVEAAKYGFHAFSHRMQIKGLCETCFGFVSQLLMPLSMVETGGVFKIKQIVTQGKNENNGFTRHLMDMGLVKGITGEVISRGLGKIVVNIKGNRIALGRGQGQRILVTIHN